MRKIVNIILTMFSIISIILSLKLSSLPVIPYLSESAKNFWVTSIELQEKYILLYDLSLGFLLSVIFYVIVDVIPDKMKIYKSKKILSPHINRLLEYMEQIITLTISKYNLTRDLKAISAKDFLVLNGDVRIPNEEISYCTTTYYNDNKRKTAVCQYNTLDKMIKYNISKILETLEHIKKYEYLYVSHYNFMETIRSIEECSLISFYRNDKKNESKCFLLYGTHNAMSEFVKLFLLMKKLKYHTEYTITTIDSPTETKLYREKRNSGQMIHEVMVIQQERHIKSLNNRILIVYDDTYNTNIIVKKMMCDIEAEFVDMKNFIAISLNKYKFIVVIGEKINLNNIFHNLKQKVNVIVVRTSAFARLKCNKINISNINIVKEIPVKCIYRLPNTNLYIHKSEPSEETISKITNQIEEIRFSNVD